MQARQRVRLSERIDRSITHSTVANVRMRHDKAMMASNAVAATRRLQTSTVDYRFAWKQKENADACVVDM